MDICDEVFLRRKADRDRLIEYGFTGDEGLLTYTEKIMDGQFLCRVFSNKDGRMAVKVIDVDTLEEYDQFNVRSSSGSFVGAIRQSVSELLEDIAAKCCDEVPFLFGQANRIEALINERYDDSFDRPFKRFPTYAVFRCPGGKWYALIMDIPFLKLSGNSDDKQIVEVLNVRFDPSRKEEILSLPGVYPSYHMNSDNWISVVLDDTLDDDRIMELICTSRDLVLSESRKIKGVQGQWIVPANPHYYDLDALFAKDEDILWKQGAAIKPGDIVYIYITAPVSAVMYRCLVTKTDIPYVFSGDNVRMKKVMRLDVLNRYRKEDCPFEKLRTLGITAIRGARSVTDDFLRFMEQTDI